MVKKLAIMAVATAFILNAKSEEATTNLVKNGDFGIINSKGLPVGWNAPNTQKHECSEDKTDKPEGCANSLKIVIKNKHKWQGYIAQYIKGIEPNTEFVLTGKTKSTMKKLAFLQIKLLKDKKELKRITTSSSTVDWQTLTKEFSSGEADTINVLCRFSQAQKAVGETVWFADIKLEKKSK